MNRRPLARILALSLSVAVPAAPAAAQSWSDVSGPTVGAPRSIGKYNNGCIAGAVALPFDGPGYQVIRTKRRRYFGHPVLIRYLKTFAASLAARGLGSVFVADMNQPRGGPMPSGHASHQSGLDADVWLRLNPAPIEAPPDRREDVRAVSMVASGGLSVDGNWTPAHVEMVKLAASFPEVARIFVNAAIKRALCDAAGKDRAWLRKVRPWYGHVAHMHVRLECPADSAQCTPQDPPPAGDGCGAELDWWFTDEALNPRKQKPTGPRPPRPPLPAACQALVAQP